MELRQLRYLVALTHELNFTNAAARAHVAQPALSRQIRKLEDELGVALVDRTSRRVQMTAAGQRLAQHAQMILDQVESARAEVAQGTGLTSGRLSIGATQTPGPLDISGLLTEFHARYPAVALAVREDLSVAIADRLRSDELELGFVSELAPPARHGLELRQIATEPMVIALPPTHRLAARAELEFAELDGEPFVLFPEGATIRDTADQLFRAHELEAKVAFVTTDTARICEMVSLGFGVSLLPLSDARRSAQELATAAVIGEELTYSVHMARRRSRRQSPAVLAMIDLIESSF